MATLLARLSESIADEIFDDAAFIMLTNRKVGANGAVDDRGGYTKEFLAIHIAEWIEEFLADEKERILAEGEAVDAMIQLLKKGGA